MSLTVRLCGGHANQCWQYGMGLATAQRLGTDLVLNTSSFHGDPQRRYSLNLWAGVTEKVQSYPPQPPIVQEEGLPYNQGLVDSIKDGDTLAGYWQSPKYLQSVKQELKRRFTPKQELTDEAKRFLDMILEAGPSSTFLTVRRTDYLNSDFHGVLGPDYYLKALKIVSSKVSPFIFVFSDEPEWCKTNLQLPYLWTVCGNYDQTTPQHLGREDSELTLMFNCHNAICANSSYSVLGAWLGADENGGEVVRPKRWFGSESNEDPRDICPDRWIRV